MGSKKNKKVKQEQTQEAVEIEDVEKPSKIHKRKRQLAETVDTVDEVDSQGPPVTKKKKFAKKVIEIQEDVVLSTPKKTKEISDSQYETDSQTPSKPKKKKKKNKSIADDLEPDVIQEEPNVVVTNGMKREQLEHVIEIDMDDVKLESPGSSSKETDDPAIHSEVSMPQNDLLELIRRIGVLLPENDCLSYKCRSEKINWDDIAFSHYSAVECKKTWSVLQKRIRRYRILKEVLEDAKSFVTNPPKSKKKSYPGMPIKPPTSYQLFYKKKKPLLLAEKPGLDIAEISKQISQMFKNLLPEKKAKYEEQAAQRKAKYDEELQAFYENHPELAESIKKDKMSENKPIKPSTPYMLFFKNQLRKNGTPDGKDATSDNAFKEQCKAQWKQLSMKKKMLWITKAEQDVTRYEEEMKEYISKHPNYNHVPMKSILNKEEIALKERYLGKPDKPPTSAYSLFSKNLLQSDEIKKINSKDRMIHIAAQWKNCTEEEKGQYKAKVEELMEQYRKDYEKYVDSLPEDKKQLELQKNAPKKKPESSDKKKKAKGKIEKVPEPAPPPKSVFRYFMTLKNFEDKKEAKKEWKKLTEEERIEYEKKLLGHKKDYIVQYEKYLHSLSKTELTEVWETKKDANDLVDDDTASSSSEQGDDSEHDDEDSDGDE